MSTPIDGRRIVRRAWPLLAAVALAGVVAAVLWPNTPPAIGHAGTIAGPACDAASRAGGPGRDDTRRTADGLALTVVAPADYRPERGYGLIVAFPPAGFSPSAAERFYGLSTEATSRGWIVAYPVAVPLSRRALALQQKVAATVAATWCVDPERVVYLGHSDGASVSEGLMLRDADARPRPRAVVASAAGLRGEDLGAERCPAPFALTVLHDPADQRFPDWGAQVTRWWAACWRCSGDPQDIGAGQCGALGGCVEGAALRYCRSTQGHNPWPREARAVFDWLEPFAPRRATASAPRP